MCARALMKRDVLFGLRYLLRHEQCFMVLSSWHLMNAERRPTAVDPRIKPEELGCAYRLSGCTGCQILQPLSTTKLSQRANPTLPVC